MGVGGSNGHTEERTKEGEGGKRGGAGWCGGRATVTDKQADETKQWRYQQTMFTTYLRPIIGTGT